MARPPGTGHDAATATHLGGPQQQSAPRGDSARGEETPAEVPSVRVAGEPPATTQTRAGLDTTKVLPYAGSRASKRTRRLRAWMMTVPIDVVALLTRCW